MENAMRDYWEGLKDEIARRPVVASAEAAVKTAGCPICGGRGWFVYDVAPGDARFGKAQRCTNPQCEAASALADRALNNYELPKNYRRLTFAGWEALPDDLKVGKWEAYLAAWAFAEHPQHWVNLREIYRGKLDGWQALPDVEKNALVFYGPMGVGKTGFVAAIMNRLSQGGYPGILYRRTSDLLQDLQDAFNDRDKASDAREMSFAQRMGRYQKASILILDEWEIKNSSDFRLQCVEDIIRYRHGNGLPMLITTNMSRDDSYRQWTERTADVLAEMAHWVPVDAPKLRGG